MQLLVDPQVAAMMLHFVLAAAAVGGAALMLLTAGASATPDDTRLVQAGGWLTLGATLGQLPVGALVLFHPCRRGFAATRCWAVTRWLPYCLDYRWWPRLACCSARPELPWAKQSLGPCASPRCC